MPMWPRQDDVCLLTIVQLEIEVICCGCGILLLKGEPHFYGGVYNKETTLCLGCLKDMFRKHITYLEQALEHYWDKN